MPILSGFTCCKCHLPKLTATTWELYLALSEARDGGCSHSLAGQPENFLYVYIHSSISENMYGLEKDIWSFIIIEIIVANFKLNQPGPAKSHNLYIFANLPCGLNHSRLYFSISLFISFHTRVWGKNWTLTSHYTPYASLDFADDRPWYIIISLVSILSKYIVKSIWIVPTLFLLKLEKSKQCR